MNIYSRGNAAKQWIFEELDRRYGQKPLEILDLACGDAVIWHRYLETHPHTQVTGIDTDQPAIKRGIAANIPNLHLSVFDVQKKQTETKQYDVVLTLSAIEHIVDRAAFVKTVWSSLRPGGFAFLNYDAGHFRSSDLQERVMVPVSQALAALGYEAPYMKKVDDGTLLGLCSKQGFTVIERKKHNVEALKKFMKGATDDALSAWFAFEAQLNAQYTPTQLDMLMLSTTVVLQKPE